jgi:hypothetical protein
MEMSQSREVWCQDINCHSRVRLLTLAFVRWTQACTMNPGRRMIVAWCPSNRILQRLQVHCCMTSKPTPCKFIIKGLTTRISGDSIVNFHTRNAFTGIFNFRLPTFLKLPNYYKIKLYRRTHINKFTSHSTSPWLLGMWISILKCSNALKASLSAN